VFNKSIILGLETDFQGSGFSESGSSYGLTATTDRNGTLHMQQGQVSTNIGIGWIGTVRARLGFLLTPSLLVFGTGGFAYGNTYANINTYGLHWHPQDEPSHPHPPNAVTPRFTSINSVSVGWTVGGGQSGYSFIIGVLRLKHFIIRSAPKMGVHNIAP
jgi:outer membrane immunogenic protein